MCVKWGSKYGPEYVNKLARGVRRHMPDGIKVARFVCFTDDAEGLDEAVVSHPLPTRHGGRKWHGWWHKAALFNTELMAAAGITGRLLYIDLDTVITGSLADVAAYRGRFTTLGTGGFANEAREGGVNSSVMLWDAGDVELCDAIYGRLVSLQPHVFGVLHRFDHWLEMVLAVDELPVLQGLYPGQFVEYMADASGGGGRDGGDGSTDAEVPEGARVVNFPLQPKPHEAAAAWVAREWV